MPKRSEVKETKTVRLDVTSETGHLDQVIVHTPGAEMELVSPDKLEALLFEDILFLGQARKEHRQMCTLFDKIVGREGAVLQISQLLREAFTDSRARESFVEQLCSVWQEGNLQAFAKELTQLSPDELCHFALTGATTLPIYSPPLPNLMFTRDLAVVVGDRMVLSHPATAARRRESVIMNVVAYHHPAFAPYKDNIIVLPRGTTFEGGDLLVVSDKAVLIGHSERSSFGGVISVTRALFEQTAIEHVILVNLPKKRYCMHLDTVFTFISPNECVVYPPLIDVHGLGNVVRFTPSDGPERMSMTIHADLQNALETVLERPITFHPCGGNDPLSQQREQWTDGANFFALAPGVIIGYDRNKGTFKELSRHGYRVVSAAGFLSYHEESDFELGEKIAIKLDGHELSRGRGGPRCMTLPLARAPFGSQRTL